jgi:N-acetylglutamate synthase-like GNAT family acetyltransferase
MVQSYLMNNKQQHLDFRKANLADIPAMNELVNSAYRGETSKKGWTTEAEILDGQRVDAAGLQEELAKENNAFLLCFKDQVLVGSVFMQNKNTLAYIGMLTIRPELQAAGLGRQLLTAAEQWIADNWQLNIIEMTVIQKRQELIAWYNRRGYLPTGETQPFPYGDERFGKPKVDDLEFIVLQKELA